MWLKLNLTMNHLPSHLITTSIFFFITHLTSALSVKILTKINWIAACFNYSQFYFMLFSSGSINGTSFVHSIVLINQFNSSILLENIHVLLNENTNTHLHTHISTTLNRVLQFVISLSMSLFAHKTLFNKH